MFFIRLSGDTPARSVFDPFVYSSEKVPDASRRWAEVVLLLRVITHHLEDLNQPRRLVSGHLELRKPGFELTTQHDKCSVACELLEEILASFAICIRENRNATISFHVTAGPTYYEFALSGGAYHGASTTAELNELIEAWDHVRSANVFVTLEGPEEKPQGERGHVPYGGLPTWHLAHSLGFPAELVAKMFDADLEDVASKGILLSEGYEGVSAPSTPSPGLV